MNKYLLLLCLALCGCTTVFAQIKINGHVDDKDASSQYLLFMVVCFGGSLH